MFSHEIIQDQFPLYSGMHGSRKSRTKETYRYNQANILVKAFYITQYHGNNEFDKMIPHLLNSTLHISLLCKYAIEYLFSNVLESILHLDYMCYTEFWRQNRIQNPRIVRE